MSTQQMRGLVNDRYRHTGVVPSCTLRGVAPGRCRRIPSSLLKLMRMIGSRVQRLKEKSNAISMTDKKSYSTISFCGRQSIPLWTM